MSACTAAYLPRRCARLLLGHRALPCAFTRHFGVLLCISKAIAVYSATHQIHTSAVYERGDCTALTLLGTTSNVQATALYAQEAKDSRDAYRAPWRQCRGGYQMLSRVLLASLLCPRITSLIRSDMK